MNDSDFIAYENHRLTVANAELRKERDELEHRIKRLEEAGDAMAAWLLDPRNLGGGSSMASQWLKAKEAKP